MLSGDTIGIHNHSINVMCTSGDLINHGLVIYLREYIEIIATEHNNFIHDIKQQKKPI